MKTLIGNQSSERFFLEALKKYLLKVEDYFYHINNLFTLASIL